jgi:hypothetical protein
MSVIHDLVSDVTKKGKASLASKTATRPPALGPSAPIVTQAATPPVDQLT